MLDFLRKIESTSNSELEKNIIDNLNNLTKPQGSLGDLEKFVLKYCLCKGGAKIENKFSKEVYTFAGDHGVTEEKITPFPSEVTYQMVLNMVNGGAAVSVMCKQAGIKYKVVDMGVKADFEPLKNLIILKEGYGTKNFSKEPAMSESECANAIKKGYNLARKCKASIIGLGEMGIGNTSSASAIFSLILGIPANETVGIGTGSIGELLNRKIETIKRSVEFHKKAGLNTPFDILRRVGGYEIAGMTGMFLGAATKRIPAVVDGFISSAAALIAMRIDSNVKDHLFFSHASGENFHSKFLKIEGIKPILDLKMRLGEGTGSVLAIQIIEQALCCYKNMATFSSAGVSSC